MGQWWKTNPLLVRPQGNYGSLYGDPNAAMRYIEVGMAEFAWDCFFKDWNEALVNFHPNYSGDTLEPDYLPARYPLILLTGTSGLGYGLFSGIPCYNINEVIDLTIDLIKNPNKKKVVLVPDFPTMCDIVDTDFAMISEKGEGTFRMRGHIEITEDGNLEIQSIPYQSTLDKIEEQIKKLVEKSKMNDFEDLLDYTERSKDLKDDTKPYKFKYTVILKKGADPEKIRQILYKSTDLESTFTVNFEMVNDFENVHYNVKSYLLDWISFRREVKRRYYLYNYSSMNKRYHMLKCILSIVSKPGADKELINIMRTSANRAEIAKTLIKKYGITDLQADVISDFKYSNLSKESLKRYAEEAKQLEKEMKEIYEVIHDDEIIDKQIIEELKECKEKYGHPRLSKVIQVRDENYVEPSDHMVVITKRGMVKKLPFDTEEIGVLEPGDKAINQLLINNRDELLVFDNVGKCYNLKVSDLLDTSINSVGYNLSSYINTNNKIVTMLRKPKETDDSSLVFVTKSGMVKKSELGNYSNVNKAGLIGITLKEFDDKAKDKLVDVILLGKRNKDILIYTANGKAIRFNTKEIPTTLRMSSGVIGIRLGDDDTVIGMNVIDKSKDYLVMVTEKGNAKKVVIENCSRTARATEGYTLITLDDKEKIAGMKAVDKDDTVDIYFNNRIETINVSDIKEATKLAKGKKTVTCKKGEHIIMVG